jgi:uncharacterized damage-inducible protein DinB
MPRPDPQDAAIFYHNYISLAQGSSVAEVMASHAEQLKKFYAALPEEKGDYAYAEGKWTIKELLQHLIDAERVFSYRALRIARKDATPLPSFDENVFAENSKAGKRSLQSLKDELNAVRASTDLLFSSLDDEQLSSTGTASNHSITVNAIGYIVFGHLLHHQRILEQRYL